MQNLAASTTSLAFYLSFISFSTTESDIMSERAFIITMSILLLISSHTNRIHSMLFFTTFAFGWACFQPAITNGVNLVSWVLAARAFCRICNGE